MPYRDADIWKLLAAVLAGKPVDFSGQSDEDVFSHAMSHGIVPLLNQGLQSGCVTGLESTINDRLAKTSRDFASQDLILTHNTRRILNVLAEKGVPALLMKGTAMAQLHYSESYLRTRCDTDIYIREQDVNEVRTLLVADGYDVSGTTKRHYSSKQFVATCPSFQNIRNHFDIHWKVSNRILFQAVLPFDECFEKRQPVLSLGRAAYAFSDIDLLLHACLHRIGHGRNTERNRLLWLFDVRLLWNALSETERESFTQKARDKKIGALCADALASAECLFPEQDQRGSRRRFLERLNENRTFEPSAKLINASRLRWVWADLAALQGLQPKLAFTRELIGGKF